jgi:flavin reductase (DIM6/NTAB) family NADH-FMN oxidoreductase RutF
MHFDFSQLTPRQASKLLVGTIVPRPIALVTTVDENGNRNAAPFSFFNCMSTTPPVVVLGLENRGPGTMKDTYANIEATKEFVVHLVDEALAEAMNVMSTDFPSGVDEIAEAGVETVPSIAVRPPRIAQAPVALECRRTGKVDLGDGRSIEIGEVLHMHIRDDVVDPEKHYVDTAKLGLIARLQNPGWYVRTSDIFQLRRMSVADWESRRGAGTPSDQG